MYEVVEADGLTVIVVDDVRFAVAIHTSESDLIGKNPLLPVANIFIPEGEIDACKRALEHIPHGTLFAHAEHGQPAIRNHLLRMVFRPELAFVYLASANFSCFDITVSHIARQFKSTADCLAAIYHAACVAMEIPSGLFGFAARPSEASPMDPFSLRERVMGDVGIIDREIRFDESLPAFDDADFFLQALAKYGVVWKDARFCARKEARKGQAAPQRDDLEKRAYEQLAAKWGSDIVSGNVAGIKLRVP